MKTRKFLWALLPMMAAALMTTACSSDDDSTPVTPKPGTDQTVKSIPYTVTVNSGIVTRATVADDNTTLQFAAGDKLYVQNPNGDIYGFLDLQSGAGAADGATFSGNLYYTDSEPTNGITLNATLVGANDKLAIVSNGKLTGFKAYNASDNICATLADAIQKFSKLQGSSTYGADNYVLTQKTAFLKFKVVLEDGTTPGDKAVNVTVKDGSTILGTGTTVASGTEQFVDTYAEFFLPAEGGTSVSTAAKMWVGSVGSEADESIAFGAGNAITLAAGYVYRVAEKSKEFVRLWAGGPVWATKNLGATSVTDYGDYYQWGETTPVTDTSINLGWNEKCPYWVSGYSTGSIYLNNYVNHDLKFKKYVNSDQPEYWGGEGDTPDGLTTLEAADDAATAKLGSSWRMPTIYELASRSKGLINDEANASYTWTTVNNVVGGKFTGKGSYAGKAIFLPAPGNRWDTSIYKQDMFGYYWSSALHPRCSGSGRYFDISSDGVGADSDDRCDGLSIRPVRTN